METEIVEICSGRGEVVVNGLTAIFIKAKSIKFKLNLSDQLII